MPSYQSAEAFCLMTYQCEACGHRERIWNSRDGVVPFLVACPVRGCDGMSAHTEWGDDRRFMWLPAEADRVFVRIDPELDLPWAESCARERAEAFADPRGMSADELDEFQAGLVETLLRDDDTGAHCRAIPRDEYRDRGKPPADPVPADDSLAAQVERAFREGWAAGYAHGVEQHHMAPSVTQTAEQNVDWAGSQARRDLAGDDQ